MVRLRQGTPMTMQYVSTRGGTEPVAFREAVMTGMASDGGLLLPASIPNVADRLGRWRSLPYTELAFEIMSLFADLPDPDQRSLLDRSYAAFRRPEVTPLVRVGPVHVLELFHGPTLAFKDVALQFLGRLFEYVLRKTGGHLNVLGATSGDTGSAAIHGVRCRDGIRIFVLHPYGRISDAQARQMTSVLDENVFNIGIEGTFDDCQRIMKELFGDLEFKQRHRLGSINSINWARLLAQIVYYFYGAFRAMEATGRRSVRFSVPTGNFGDIMAGYLAARMGLPVSRLVLATNENDILARFFTTGVYSLGPVHSTISPSMDIQVASNFERYLYYRVERDAAQVRHLMGVFRQSGRLKVSDRTASGAVDDLIAAGTATTAATTETIRRFHADHGYLLDPHTAVGVHVAGQHLSDSDPMICLATAHPAKFGRAILDATGSDLAHHAILDALSGLPTRCEVLPANTAMVRAYLDEHAMGR